MNIENVDEIGDIIYMNEYNIIIIIPVKEKAIIEERPKRGPRKLTPLKGLII